MGTLQQAKEYLARGWSVIPLRKDKKPHIKWERYQAGLPGAGELDVWWTQWPDTNVGIVTGKISGLIVVDVDGPEGMESLKLIGALPPTPCVQTGKGWHYYFKHPGGDNIRNFARRLPGLDLRGDGGYVVAPPSIHLSGNTYEWAIHPDDAELADLPEGVLKLINEKPTAEKTSKLNDTPKWVKKLLAGVERGGRNSGAARLAGHYLAKGLPPSEVEELLHLWNMRNQPPLPDDEIRTVVTSVTRAEAESIKGSRNFDITKITKIDTRPAIYYVHIFDSIVKMDKDDISTFARFKKLVYEETNRMPAMKNHSRKWDTYIDEISNSSRYEVVDAPEETRREVLIWLKVVRYLKNKAVHDDETALTDGRAWVDGDLIYFQGPILFENMYRSDYSLKMIELWNVLRQNGAVKDRKRVNDIDGKKVDVRCWKLPYSILGTAIEDDDEQDQEDIF